MQSKLCGAEIMLGFHPLGAVCSVQCLFCRLSSHLLLAHVLLLHAPSFILLSSKKQKGQSVDSRFTYEGFILSSRSTSQLTASGSIF